MSSPPRTLGRARTNLAAPPPAPTPTPTPALSPATELIGRDDELAVLLDLIATARLVTLSGPGGSGKTRLALELAHRAAEGFDAVWWVALDPIPDPNEVMGAIARTMGLPEVGGVEATERVLDHLRGRSVLLVLDALEHVIDVAPLIGQVARVGPEVRVLVTSTMPLRVAGEHMLTLDPLPVPTGSESGVGALRSVPSVALLAAGAAGWELTESDRYDVARLCRLLEGLPLALELAASALGTVDAGAHDAGTVDAGAHDAGALDAGALCRHLEENLDTPGARADVPARERGLRAMLTWLVGRLSPSERSLLLGLAVFSDGFTAPLARAAFGDVDPELEVLLRAGLVRHAGGDRLHVPAPVRRLAAELMDAEADDSAHAAVTDALIALAEPFEQRWVARWGEGGRVLGPEGGNVVAELDWAQLMDYGRHARLAAATGWWMCQTGAGEFARDHLEIALARSTDPVMRARCLQGLGALGLTDSDPTASLDAADAWHDLDDVAGEFYSAVHAAHLYGQAREGEAQIEVADRCAELTARLTDDPDAAWLLTLVQAEAVALLGHPEESVDPLLAEFAQAPEGSSRRLWLATRLAGVELALHRPGDALAHGGAAIALAAELGTPADELSQATLIAAALLNLGRAPEAASVWAVCEVGFDELSWLPDGEASDLYEAVRASLDEDALAAARREAAQMGMERGLVWVGQVARGEV